VVAGGQGPGQRDQESLDRDRARLPLPGPRCIVILGCHASAGQTTITLITGRLLASLRGHPVAALDLNTPNGPTAKAADLDIIAPGQSPDYAKLAERYRLTLVDPAPAGLARVLNLADQLILVAPPSPEGASSLANTQQWLDAHGHGDLAARSVTVLNGVRKQAMSDALRVESVARGRCRAIVRVPWDDQLATPPKPQQAQQTPQTPQTRLAYTALAGVLIAGMAAPAPGTGASTGTGRSPGEHEG
jgi:MinD-like ATPase involved in chromosome partitioning or flagellar assembly